MTKRPGFHSFRFPACPCRWFFTREPHNYRLPGSRPLLTALSFRCLTFLTLSFRSSVRGGVDWSSRSFKSYRIFYDTVCVCVWWINYWCIEIIIYYSIWIDIIHSVRVSQISGWICTSATKLTNCSVNEQPWFCYLSLHYKHILWYVWFHPWDRIFDRPKTNLHQSNENVKSWQWRVKNLIIYN